MTKPDIYNDIFEYAKEQIIELSNYEGVQVKKVQPEVLNQSPLVVIERPQLTIDDETLKYGEKLWNVDLTINIFATDYVTNTTKIARQKVIEDLDDILYEIFSDTYKMDIIQDLDTPNVDTSIDRRTLRITAKVNEKKRIYRR